LKQIDNTEGDISTNKNASEMTAGVLLTGDKT
jgi:hypothetical protein